MYCWLDAAVNSDENKPLREDLKKAVTELVTFDQPGNCEKYIREHYQQQINLIVAGGLGRELIPRIHDVPQLVGFYVFCMDRKRNEEWANQYLKVCTSLTTTFHY